MKNVLDGSLVTPDPPMRSPRTRIWAGLGIGVVAGALSMCACGCGLLYLAADKLGLFGETGSAGPTGLFPLFQLVGIALLLAAAQAGTAVWAWRVRPRWRVIAAMQLPYIIGYAWLAYWWETDKGSPWWIPWTVASIAALAWLLVWYVRDSKDPRRAMVFLVCLAVILDGNAVGVFAVGWQRTGGYGFAGQPNPWTAFETMTRTTCLTEHDSYWRGNRIIDADCPSGPEADFYAGDYDEEAFREVTCSDQPRAAFKKWWDWNKRHQLLFILEFEVTDARIDGVRVGPPFRLERDDGNGPTKVDGKSSTLTVTMRIDGVSDHQDREHFRMKKNRETETWNVQVEPTLAGGWKVCRIEIEGPIDAEFVTLPAPSGSPAPTVSPSPSLDLFREMRCSEHNPFRESQCLTPTPTPPPTPTPTPS